MAQHELQAATTYAADEGETIPVETPETATMLSNLAGLSGADLDSAYRADQIADHELNAQQMNDHAVQGRYEPLMRYDTMVLPEAREHLAHFLDLQAEMGGASSDAM